MYQIPTTSRSKRLWWLLCLSAGLAGTPAAASDFFGGPSGCEKPIAAKGFPNQTETMARLSAIRLWTQAAAEKFGPEFSMWHNADAQVLRCNTVQRSSYVACFARGRPCKAKPGKTSAR